MPKPSLGFTKINFLIDPTTLRAMKWLAAARGTTYSELLRGALKEFVLREIKLERESLITLAAVDNEQRNSEQRGDSAGDRSDSGEDERENPRFASSA